MLIIDRIEGDYAVIETDAGMVNIPKADLPDGAKEGTVLTLHINGQATVTREQKIDSMMNKLFKD